MLTVKIETDSELDCPNEFGGWNLYSFSRKHNHYKDPSALGLDSNGRPSIALRRKLETGTAFLLSYYEHSGCLWRLHEQANSYPFTCPWDAVRTAGLLVWEGKLKDLPKGRDARAAQAAGFVETFTAWANGYGWCYSVEDENGDGDSCGGFYDDTAYMLSLIAEAIDGRPYQIEGTGSVFERELQAAVAKRAAEKEKGATP